jgi:hypothetical protein
MQEFNYEGEMEIGKRVDGSILYASLNANQFTYANYPVFEVDIPLEILISLCHFT